MGKLLKHRRATPGKERGIGYENQSLRDSLADHSYGQPAFCSAGSDGSGSHGSLHLAHADCTMYGDRGCGHRILRPHPTDVRPNGGFRRPLFFRKL